MPKNIVYILTDQHRWDMLGCYGHPLVRTPNIDRLAAEGVRFTQAYTPTAICGPARASLLTGLVPTQHGVVGNAESVGGGRRPTLSPDTATLIDYLPGYHCAISGKWHADDARLPSDLGFHGHDFGGYGFPGSGVYENMAFDQPPESGNPYRDWLNDRGFAAPSLSDAYFGNNPNQRIQELYGKLSGPAEASIPHFIVDEAKSMVDGASNGTEPFFLWMNFWGPHTPCIVPEPYFSMYRPQDIPEDPGFLETFANKPIHQRYIAQMWGVYELEWPRWQEIIARYFGYITLIDDCIGDFLSHLDKNGLTDDTVIVFTADHGDAMGAHQLIEKGEFMYDETYRIPLVVRHPDCQTPGTTCDEFVYLHDLCATASEIATGTAPELGQAQSILPQFVDNSASTGRDYAYGQFTRHFVAMDQRMLRTRSHKLVFNASAIGELYDLENDPHELTNQINNPAYAETKAELLSLLASEMTALNDPLHGWFDRIRHVY